MPSVEETFCKTLEYMFMTLLSWRTLKKLNPASRTNKIVAATVMCLKERNFMLAPF